MEFKRHHCSLKIGLLLMFLLAQAQVTLHGYDHLSDLDHNESSDCKICLISHALNDSNHTVVTLLTETQIHIPLYNNKPASSVCLEPYQDQFSIRAPPRSIAS